MAISGNQREKKKMSWPDANPPNHVIAPTTIAETSNTYLPAPDYLAFSPLCMYPYS
jgi:hypothetical protein